MKHSAKQSLYKSTLMLFLFLLFVNTGIAADLGCEKSKGEIDRAMFTTQIEDREPVNHVLILESKYKKVYFFTDLRHFEGQEIVHRWEHDGHVVSEKAFSVKGPRWRVFSSLRLNESMIGRWTVVVTNKQGCPLKAVVFKYVATDPNGEGSAILDLKK